MVIDLITFKVKQGKEREFERRHEDWVRLLRRSRGFISEVLMRNVDQAAEYRAEVRWTSRDYRDRFSAHEEREAALLAQSGAAPLDGPAARTLLEIV